MMIKSQILVRILLAGLLVSCGIAAVGATNLTIEKNVTDWEVDYPLANVTWMVNLTNLNETAVGVNVTETVPNGCVVVSNTTSNGTYLGNVWNLTLGAYGEENLTLTMNCTLSCKPTGKVELKNQVAITTPIPQDDDEPDDNEATSSIEFDVPTCPNLTIEKNVINSKIDYPLANVTWMVNLTNLNETAVGVNVTETVPPGCVVVSNTTSNGTYLGNIWNLTLGAYGEENLTLKTNCTLSCNPTGKVRLINRVAITSPIPEGDDKSAYNEATSSIEFNVPTCYGQIIVKPETLNLKTVSVNGNGVATVFITVGDRVNRTDVNSENIHIKCNNATPDKILFNERDNGTLMLKFRRGDLEFDTVEQTAWINCSGTIELQDGTLEIEGGDEVRVTHAEAIQSRSLFERLLQFLGITPAEEGEEDEDENGDAAITPTLIPEDVKNFGQLKKVLQIQKQEGSTEDDTEIQSEGNGNGKGKEKKNPNLETEDENENGSNGKGKGAPPEDVPARSKNK